MFFSQTNLLTALPSQPSATRALRCWATAEPPGEVSPGKQRKVGPRPGNRSIGATNSNHYLVGGAITILKNDGIRQWEG